MTSYDQARQFGKTYVGALNTGDEAFSALFADGARVSVGGDRGTPGRVREVTPPGRSGFKGVELDGEGFQIRVRVIDPTSVEDRMHHVELDDAGRIAHLEA